MGSSLKNGRESSRAMRPPLHFGPGMGDGAPAATQGAVEEAEGDRLRAEAAERNHRPIVCSGRPGAGKTTVVHCNVRETLASGSSVLVALPTARLATRMAARLGNHESLVVDTFTAAFQLHKPEQEGLYAMYGYDLVVVDEFSQLGRADFERILRLWRAADCLPALVFLGDKCQLPGVDPQRAWESAAWSSGNCYFLELTQVFHYDDPAFLETLQLLRTAVPSKTQLNKICRGHKAWAGDKPAADDLRRLLREHPEATIVAATKQGVAELSALALEALPRAAGGARGAAEVVRGAGAGVQGPAPGRLGARDLPEAAEGETGGARRGGEAEDPGRAGRQVRCAAAG